MRRLPNTGIVLASRSPQRSAILTQLGIPFRVVVSTFDEQVADHQPHASAENNARGKAREVMTRCAPTAGELVLGVDTLVMIGGRVLGKARDEVEAREYLQLLSGHTHEVVSGLYLTDQRTEFCDHAVTAVTFAPLTSRETDAYVATGEWRERAGAYAIQGFGSALVASVVGDYQNVVGLPVALLMTALVACGVAPLSWHQSGAAPA